MDPSQVDVPPLKDLTIDNITGKVTVSWDHAELMPGAIADVMAHTGRTKKVYMASVLFSDSAYNLKYSLTFFS